MMATNRTETNFRLKMNGRFLEVKAFDTVGVEDAYNVLMRSALHRIMTREDWTEPTAREIKDFIIKTNLVV